MLLAMPWGNRRHSGGPGPSDFTSFAVIIVAILRLPCLNRPQPGHPAHRGAYRRRQPPDKIIFRWLTTTRAKRHTPHPHRDA
jgi:hypothetical protein